MRKTALALAASMLSACGGAGSSGTTLVPIASPSGNPQHVTGGPPIAIQEIAIPNGASQGGVAQGPDGSVYVSEYGFENTPVTIGARYANGRFTTLTGTDPAFVGPTTGPVAATANGDAFFAALGFQPPGSGPPPTGTAVMVVDPGSSGVNTFVETEPGNLSDMAADSKGNIWYILGCECLQFIPYVFLDKNLGALDVPLGSGNIGTLVLQALAISPDASTVWVASIPPNSTTGGSIYRISSSGTILQTYAVPAGTNIAGMAALSDDAVWYTDSGHNAIGKLSNAGVFTSYAIPSPASGPDRITAGGDGALWFTETSAGKIGQITPQGSITEYAIPTSNAGPSGIAGPAGPGCNPDVIWFVEQNVNKLGKITIQS